MRLCLALVTVLILGISCGKNDQQGERLDFVPQQLEIPAGLNPVRAWVFPIGPVSTDHSRFESITNVPWEDWTRVEPARASLTINESGLNWDFVLEVSLRAYKGDDPSTAKEIFYKDLIQGNTSNRLDLIPTDFDANLGLLDGEEITLELELTRLRNSPPQNLPVVIQFGFEGFR